MPFNYFANKTAAKRNRDETREWRPSKLKPKRYVSYGSQQTQKFSLNRPERTWEADERRRLRRRKHGWK